MGILNDPVLLFAYGFVIFFAIGLHEYAHCKFADMAGDPTPGIYGRVTLNLTKHFELYGTLMMLFTMSTGFGIGWGRPAPMDPKKMRDPRWDFFAAVAAGPISNVLQAAVYGCILKLLVSRGEVTAEMVNYGLDGRPEYVVAAVLYLGVVTNLSLAVFNLIPIGPLDGHWLIGLLMPERTRDKWFYYNKRYGYYALLAIVLLGQAQPRLSLLSAIRRPLITPIIEKIGL